MACPQSNQLLSAFRIGTSGHIRDVTTTVWRVPNASEQGTQSAAAHKWADGICNPCRLGSPTLQSGGHSEQWPTSRRIGYVTPTVWGPQSFRAGNNNNIGSQKWKTLIFQ